MSTEFDAAAAYLKLAIDQLRGQKRLADRALEQLIDDDLHWQPDAESNSIAVQITHLAGNMRSRWRDFLDSDGEKPDRERDREFVDEKLSRGELMEVWEAGWGYTFAAVEALTPDHLGWTVTIRREPHSVLAALNRQVAHYAYHTGQIVYMARHRCAIRPEGDTWTSLSVPKGESKQFETKLRKKHSK
jgi:hypothetical protein